MPLGGAVLEAVPLLAGVGLDGVDVGAVTVGATLDDASAEVASGLGVAVESVATAAVEL